MKKHVGTGQTKLKDEISEFDKYSTIEVNLVHNPGSKQALMKGKLKMRVLVKKQFDASAPVQKIPDSSFVKAPNTEDDEDNENELNIIPATDALKTTDEQPQSRPNIAVRLDANVKVLVVKMEGFHVKDLVDTGSFVDKQDPTLTVRIGEKSFDTKR